MKLQLSPTSRAAVFWGICIPVRLYIVQLVRSGQAWIRVPASYIAWQWLSGRQVGDEGVFGGVAWWAEERTTHGVMWGAYALTGMWHALALDTAYGAFNWFIH